MLKWGRDVADESFVAKTRLHIVLTDTALHTLDELRSGLSRSAYLEHLLRRLAEARPEASEPGHATPNRREA